MTVYLGIKYHEDGSNRAEIEEIAKLLETEGHKVVCVFRDLEKWGEISLDPHDLMTRTFEIIDRSDLILIELSEKGVGLGIEAGYAHARGKPIVTIARTGSDISTTLCGISSGVILYESYTKLLTQFKPWLKSS